MLMEIKNQIKMVIEFKLGNPMFVDKSGKPVKLNEKQMKDY